MDELNTAMAQRAKELYLNCDLERKGYITKKDMARLQAMLPLTLDQLEGVFDSLDDDGNGHLTLQEFTDGFGQFITGDIGKKPGDSKDDSSHSDVVMESNEASKFDITLNKLENAGIFETTNVNAETIDEMYKRLQKTNPDILPGFETLLGKFSNEINKSHNTLHKIENTILTQTNEHEREIRRLYDEMENQISAEEQKLLAEERLKEKQLKEVLESELFDKDKLYQDALKQYEEIQQKIKQLENDKELTEAENIKIQKKKEKMEEQLDEALLNYKDAKSRLEEMQTKSKEDRKMRETAISSVSQGMLQEKDDLLNQLNTLRELNKKLRDERDEGLINNNRGGCCENSLAGEMSGLWNQGGCAENEQHGGGPNMSQAMGDGNIQGEILGESLGDYFSSNVRYNDSDDEEEEEPCENHEENGDCAVDHTKKKKKKKNKREPQVIKTQKIVKVVVPRPPKPQPEVVTHGTQPEPEEKELPAPRSEIEIQTEPEPEPEPEIVPVTNGEVKCELDQLDSAETLESPSDDKIAINYEPVFSGNCLPDCAFKIVFLGDTAVGKTALVDRFCNNAFRKHHQQTIGMDFQIKTVSLGEKLIALQVWDTAGQERFQSITRSYYRKADGVVLVYDVLRESSFKSLRRWLSSVEENMEDQDTVLMILGNKIDCVKDDGMTQTTSSDTAASLAEDYGAIYFQVSAKTGDMVQKAFETMARALKRKEEEDLKSAIRVSAAIEKKKGCCCSKKKESEKKEN